MFSFLLKCEYLSICIVSCVENDDVGILVFLIYIMFLADVDTSAFGPDHYSFADLEIHCGKVPTQISYYGSFVVSFF
jgi:hypothetical protein